MQFIRKYGVAFKIRIPVVKASASDFAVGADWTPVAGDVKVSKDGGAAANITTLPTAITMGNGAVWEFSISATEAQAAEITITVVDAATKAVQDQALSVITFGHASAGLQIDWSDAVRAGLTALPNAAAEAAGGLYTRGNGAGQITQDANGRIDANAKAWAGTATTLTAGVPDVNIKTITAGIIAAASFAANALDAVWSTASRLLTAGTNIVLAKGTGVTGFNDLDAAGVRTAAGLASANLDAQLGAIAGYIDTEVAAIKVKTDNLPSDPADASDIAAAFAAIGARLPAALSSGGNIKADVQAINGDSAAAANLAKTARAIGRGTVDAGATTTIIPTSAFAPGGAVADQFKNRVILFDADTVTVALRGESAIVGSSSNAAAPTFVITALASAPAAGDTFSII